MDRSADVVVVGGGIVGCSAAYFLSQAGARVIVVERDALGSGASGHAPGGLGIPLSYFEPPEHAYFMRQAINFLKWVAPRVAEESGMDILMRELPWLEVARSEETWEYIQEWAPKTGLKVLDAQEVLSLEPRLGPPVFGGAVQEGSGQVDSYRLTLAFAKGAELRGAEVVIGEVEGLEWSGSRVTGVVTSKETIGCDTVVLAMGAWTGQAERWVDFPLPIGPLKGELLALKPKEDRYWPFWIMSHDTTEEGQEVPTFIHMRADGLVHTGVTVEPDLYDNIPTEKGRKGMMERAIRLMPCIAESELVGHVGGPRPNPPDGTTVLGPIPGREGLFIAATLPGIINSALIGQTIADLIFQRPLPVCIDSFLPKKLAEPVKAQYGFHSYVPNRSV
ncbi:MAG: NAD(P)/FAD-dependent oxidoreductase [Dehalococcoidia bacterium]